VIFEKEPAGFQSREVTLVNLVALTLKVRTEVAAMFRAFVPFETKPTEAIVDRLRRFRGVPRLISVFNPKNKSPSGIAGKEPVEEGRARPANVQVTGGRRSEANSNRGRHQLVILSESEGTRK
jgi:hypothetical protein